MVIDTDGSAFITKAEFDSLKNNFQAQIDSYNSAIDSKIDGAIASYLSGIQMASEVLQIIPWTGGQVSFCEPLDLKRPSGSRILDYEYITFNSAGSKTSKVKMPMVCFLGQTFIDAGLNQKVPQGVDAVALDFINCAGADPLEDYASSVADDLMEQIGAPAYDVGISLDKEKTYNYIANNFLCPRWWTKSLNGRRILVGQCSIWTSPAGILVANGAQAKWSFQKKSSVYYDYFTGQWRYPYIGLVPETWNNQMTGVSGYSAFVDDETIFNLNFSVDSGVVKVGVNRRYNKYANVTAAIGFLPALRVNAITDANLAKGTYNSASTCLFKISPPADTVIPTGQLVQEWKSLSQNRNMNVVLNDDAKFGTRYDDPSWQVNFPENKLWCKGSSNADGVVMSLHDIEDGWLVSGVDELPANDTNCGTQYIYTRGANFTDDLWTENQHRPADGTVLWETPTYKIYAKDEEKYKINNVYCDLYSSDAMAHYGKSLVDGAIICEISNGADEVTLQFTLSTDTNTEVIFNKGAFGDMDDMGNISVKCGDTEYNCSTSTIPLSAGSSKTFVVNNVNSGEMYFVKPTSACTLNITNAVVLMDK